MELLTIKTKKMNTIKTTTAFGAMSSISVNGTTGMNQWTNPELVQTIELQDSIELVYKQHSLISNNYGSLPSRVFKIVFSCIDGKWNKSEPIIGQIMSAQDEYYEF